MLKLQNLERTDGTAEVELLILTIKYLRRFFHTVGTHGFHFFHKILIDSMSNVCRKVDRCVHSFW